MKKKALIAVIAFVIALSCASCTKKETGSSSSGGSSAADTSAESVANDSEDTSSSAAEVSSDADSQGSDEADDTSSPEPAVNRYGKTADINDHISTKEIDPPMWKVTDPDSGNSMYLLGTLHFTPSDVSDYPSDLMDIFNSCDSIAVEYDISILQNDLKANMEYTNSVMYSDGTTIKDHISEETYNKAKNYFTGIGAYTELLDHYTASYWINQLTSIEIMRLENIKLSGTDSYFVSKAKENGKEVINIEELSMQTDALNAYSDDYADYTINAQIDSIDDIDGFAEAYGELFDMWATGNDELLTETETDISMLPEELVDDYENYSKSVFDERNKYMADRASEFIKEGKNCLFMVGTGHYSGENGVDSLLEKKGYTVEKIS